MIIIYNSNGKINNYLTIIMGKLIKIKILEKYFASYQARFGCLDA